MRVPWKTVYLVAALSAAIVVLLWRLSVRDGGARPSATTTTADTGLTIERIQPLLSLTTLKVQVADVVESELQGKTGNVKAALIVKGEVALGVDLSTATFEQVDRENRRAVLHLPQPAVQYVRLDHERTRLLGVWSSGLWIIVPGGSDADAVTVNRAYRDAERIVGRTANDAALVQRCRVQTEEVLRSFLRALGWSIELRWR
jgi:hypothetical protein